MEWKPITLDAREEVESFLETYHGEVADLTFTNFFIWRHAREIVYAVTNGCLIVRTCYPDQTPFIFFPVGYGDSLAALESALAFFQNKNWLFTLKAISESQKEALESWKPGSFEFEEQRAHFDYVYSTQELRELKGRKFHKKKNHFNQFLEWSPNHTYESITADTAPEVKATAISWFDQIKGKAHPGLHNEHIGLCDALDHFDNLSWSGGLIRVDGKIAAFSMGELLNPEMVVIHIEKANTFYHGAHQAINKFFLDHTWSDTVYVNREEDLGIEGLRKAKLSYHPVKLITKYQARLTG